jgi:hypothetical protein
MPFRVTADPPMPYIATAYVLRSSRPTTGDAMAIDLTKLREALAFRPKPQSSGLMLDVRVTVQRDREGALLWDIGDAGSGPRGGQLYQRPADTSAAIVALFALRIDDMEREFRRT